MNCLELCAGSGSFSKAAAARGFNCVTVDVSEKYSPTHCCCIHEWDEEQYAPGFFKLVWCSTECTEYSIALRNRPRDLQKADRLATRCMQLLQKYMNEGCTVYLENPHSSLLWQRMPAAAALPHIIVDYCAYGSPMKKRTRIASNGLRGVLPRLCPKAECPSKKGGRHIMTAQTGSRGAAQKCSAKNAQWAVPRGLIDGLLNQFFISRHQGAYASPADAAESVQWRSL